MAGKQSARSKAAKAAPSTGEERVVLLTGAEATRKQAAADEMLAQKVDPDWTDFDSEILDGAGATADQVLAAVAFAPMGAGKRVAVVRNTQQMPAAEQKRLAEGLTRIPSSGFLVLHTGTEIVEDGRTRKSSVVDSELSSAVKKAGRIVTFGLPKAEDARAFVQAQAQAMGKSIDPDAVALLAQLPGEDLNRIGAELEKAALFAGDSERITMSDLEATLSRTPDDVIFKLCDAVGARRAREALLHVGTLFQGAGRPEAIAPRALALLARQLRLIIQFKYLATKGFGGRGGAPVPEEIAELLPRDGAASVLGNPRIAWMASKYAGQARNFSGDELMERMERVLAADLALKGIEPGGDSPQTVLQRLVVELC